MKQKVIAAIKFIVGMSIIVGAFIAAKAVYLHYNPPRQEHTVTIETRHVVTQRQIVWIETTMEEVQRQCDGDGSTLSCAYPLPDKCIVITVPLPKDGRSPYLNLTGHDLMVSMAIWGHELAHCLGVDVHGDGDGR